MRNLIQVPCTLTHKILHFSSKEKKLAGIPVHLDSQHKQMKTQDQEHTMEATAALVHELRAPPRHPRPLISTRKDMAQWRLLLCDLDIGLDTLDLGQGSMG